MSAVAPDLMPGHRRCPVACLVASPREARLPQARLPQARLPQARLAREARPLQARPPQAWPREGSLLREAGTAPITLEVPH